MPHNNMNMPMHRPEVLTRPKLEGGRQFVMQTPFTAAGDQPTAIRELVDTARAGEKDQVLLGVTGSGKTFCAEFALLRLWSKDKPRKAVCVEPFQEMVDLRVAEWSAKFGELQGGKRILALTGEQAADLRILSKADVVVCTPAQVRPLPPSRFCSPRVCAR